MRVQKRGDRGFENVKFDKITERINRLCTGLYNIDAVEIARNTISSLHDGISTEELDSISAKIANYSTIINPEYSILAGRILISNLHKSTSDSFSDSFRYIYDVLGLFDEKKYEFVNKYAAELDAMIVHENDYTFDYLGYKTLEKSYLIKKEILTVIDGKVTTSYAIIDRPQYIYMRVAIAVNFDLYGDHDNTGFLAAIKNCYTLLSEKYYTHATPTLFNSCGKMQQLVSCFLLGIEDSVEGIMKALTNSAIISKWAGGIGLHLYSIRGNNSYIRGTNGKSSGVARIMKMFNETARTFDQGGKRLGAFAMYLTMWHSDIFQFLEMKLNQGAESERARDLFYAVMISDLFMKRFIANEKFSLFSPDKAKYLEDVYDGMMVCTKTNYCSNPIYNKLYPVNADYEKVLKDLDEFGNPKFDFQPKNVFTELYEYYENKNYAVKTVYASEIMNALIFMMRESGTPYVLFKDHINRQSNQQGIGTIKSSNLCSEIVEYSSHESYATCVLASINLPKFLKGGEFDFKELHGVIEQIVKNLDNVIEQNDYPVEECVRNSKDYRPIGIGIQGLANIYCKLRIPFISEQAEKLDIAIAETIYHATMTASCELARAYGHTGPHVGFKNSPAARGELHFDLWARNRELMDNKPVNVFSGMYDWSIIKRDIQKYGLRNSLTVALMPTVSTSQIMGNNESFEPFSSNIYTKNILSGKFTIINKDMVNHFIELGIWNENLKNKIIENDGSVQGINEIPKSAQEIYKTVWEIKQMDLMKRNAIRSAFVDQSQSNNFHLMSNSNSILRGVITNSWKSGVKTGSYYIRMQPGGKAMRNTNMESAEFCTRDCIACSS